MPIKGLTETRRLPRLGKIRLGIKKANEKGVEYPVATDYFICPHEVQAIYGEKPKELPILIPVESEEKWCSQYYRRYSQTRGLICKGDGESAIRAIDTKTGAIADRDSTSIVMKEVSCQGKECPDYQGKKCHEVMMLQFLLPDVPGLGVWQLDTGSINAILNINSAAELIRKLHGRVSMIPLLLTLEMQAIKTPEGKKVNKPILHLRSKGTLKQMLKSAGEYLALPEGDVAEAIEEEVDELILPESQAPEGEKPEPEFDESLPQQGKPVVEMPQAITETALAAMPEEVETSDEGELWPEDKSEEQAEATTPEPQPVAPKPQDKTTEPTTLQEFMTWVQKHGKKFTPSWACKQLSVRAPAEITDIGKAYRELREMAGWAD